MKRQNTKREHKKRPLNPFSAALGNDHAAEYLDQPATSLKISRSTGQLCGVPAPEYRKVGRKVIYLRETLDEWLANLPSYANTSQSRMQA